MKYPKPTFKDLAKLDPSGTALAKHMGFKIRPLRPNEKADFNLVSFYIDLPFSIRSTRRFKRVSKFARHLARKYRLLEHKDYGKVTKEKTRDVFLVMKWTRG